MSDIKSKEERSKNMSAIKSKNTKPEVYFRKLLFAKGYRYSLHSKNIPGHPDLWMKIQVEDLILSLLWKTME